jgi:hypothetical protein
MNEYKTAIARNRPSAPAKWLHENGKLIGKMLDYGCGRGKDADTYGMDKYDPHYFPELAVMGLEILFDSYDTIMCNFVLNVIDSEVMRTMALIYIRNLLKEGGKAYISVRNDKSKLKGRTKTGTWQGLITLDLPVVNKTSSYTMYLLEK